MAINIQDYTEKPDRITLVLVDADVIAYRAAAANEDKTGREAKNTADNIIQFIIDETVIFPFPSNFKLFLTGKDNFRFKVEKDYKANRVGVPKPKYLPAVRQYLQDAFGAEVVDGMEADDRIATEATFHADPESTVIASIDKDFKTINCWHFNFNSNKWLYQTEAEALKFFYTQVLTGDAVDNIKGLYKVGPVTADKILKGETTELGLFKKALAAYEERGYTVNDLIKTAQLVHLQRYGGQMWQPPKE